MRLAVSGRLAFRRAYSDEAPKPRPGKLRRTFRWIWRLTYLSVLGALGYTAYVIYDDRHPGEQYQPDPSKKTLVVLGTSMPHLPRAPSGPRPHQHQQWLPSTAAAAS